MRKMFIYTPLSLSFTKETLLGKIMYLQLAFSFYVCNLKNVSLALSISLDGSYFFDVQIQDPYSDMSFGYCA